MFGWIRKFFAQPAKLPDLGFQPRMYELDEAPSGTVVVSVENDDKTPMEFVVAVLRDYFGLPTKTAIQIMLSVHTDGWADIRAMSRREANRLVARIRDEAIKGNYPLQCTIRPIEEPRERDET